MPIDSLNESLRPAVTKVVEALKAAGASEAHVYGASLSGFKSGDDILIAVAGLDDDHLLKVTGRLMMDQKIGVDLCRSDDSAGPFASAGSNGEKVL